MNGNEYGGYTPQHGGMIGDGMNRPQQSQMAGNMPRGLGQLGGLGGPFNAQQIQQGQMQFNPNMVRTSSGGPQLQQFPPGHQAQVGMQQQNMFMGGGGGQVLSGGGPGSGAWGTNGQPPFDGNFPLLAGGGGGLLGTGGAGIGQRYGLPGSSGVGGGPLGGAGLLLGGGGGGGGVGGVGGVGVGGGDGGDFGLGVGGIGNDSMDFPSLGGEGAPGGVSPRGGLGGLGLGLGAMDSLGGTASSSGSIGGSNAISSGIANGNAMSLGPNSSLNSALANGIASGPPRMVPAVGRQSNEVPTPVSNGLGPGPIGTANTGLVSLAAAAHIPGITAADGGHLDTVLPDSRFGLAGLLEVIRMIENRDLQNLALGSDLLTFGLNLNSAEVLHHHFNSPFNDAHAINSDPNFVTPPCYIMVAPAVKSENMTTFKLETLMFMFYTNPRDALQAMAAQELYRREWKWHSEVKVWLKARSAQELMQSQPNIAFLYFDPGVWEARLFTTPYRGNIMQGMVLEEEVRIKVSGTPGPHTFGNVGGGVP